MSQKPPLMRFKMNYRTCSTLQTYFLHPQKTHFRLKSNHWPRITIKRWKNSNIFSNKTSNNTHWTSINCQSKASKFTSCQLLPTSENSTRSIKPSRNFFLKMECLSDLHHPWEKLFQAKVLGSMPIVNRTYLPKIACRWKTSSSTWGS